MRFDLLAAVQHVMNVYCVIVLDGMEDDVVACGKTPKFRGQVRALASHTRVRRWKQEAVTDALNDANRGINTFAFPRDIWPNIIEFRFRWGGKTITHKPIRVSFAQPQAAIPRRVMSLTS